MITYANINWRYF